MVLAGSVKSLRWRSPRGSWSPSKGGSPFYGPAKLLGLRFTAAAAKPGFINVKLAPEVWHAQLRAILRAGTAFGNSQIGGGERVNVEFVSANPTGPMHVAHGRGAVVGDALAGLCPRPVSAFARVLHQRRRRPGRHPGAIDPPALSRGARRGDRRRFPEGFYPGDYLIETGHALAERDGGNGSIGPRPNGCASPRVCRRADDGADPGRPCRCSASTMMCSSRSASWSSRGGRRVSGRAGASGGSSISACWRRPRASCPTIGSRGRRPCSAPPTSATMSTGR